MPSAAPSLINFVKFLNRKLDRAANYASKTALLFVLLSVLFSPFSPLLTVPIALADTPKAGDTNDLRNATSFDSCTSMGGSASYCQNAFPVVNNNINNQGVSSGQTSNTNRVGAAKVSKDESDDALACSLTNPSVCLANVVYAFTVGLGSGLAYVGGFMLDTTVSLSLNSAAYALDFLSAGWTAARDLANMAFILILVYIAFMIMFQAETAGTIKMLAWVIFIALIINFSFFFTRVVIDVGNILAVQFYNSISADTLQQTMDATTNQTGVLASTASSIVTSAAAQGSLANTKDLTSSIMKALNLQQLFSDANFKSFANQSGFGTKFIVLCFIYIMVGACYFILAAMFLAVSVKFIVRVVVLWFLIIAAPLAFICKAMPEQTGVPVWYDRWQHELVAHAFYPAFFLFIFFFISSIMTQFGSSKGIFETLASNLNAAASNANMSGFIFIATAVATVMIRLGFVVAMLYIALKVSETMGVMGATAANKVTTFAFGSAGRLAAAPLGFAGRQTFGRLGNRAIESAKIYENRANLSTNRLSKMDLKLASRSYNAVGKALGTKSYDPRNAPGSSILKKAAERLTGPSINVGKPVEGGYLAQTKARADRIKQEQAARSVFLRDAENKKLIKELAEKSARQEALEAKEKAAPLSPDEIKEKQELNKSISSLSNKFNSLSKREVESFKAEELEKVLKHAKEGVIKKVEDSEKFSEKDKSGLREKHTEQIAIKELVATQKKAEEVGEKSLEKSQEIIEELRSIKVELEAGSGIPHNSLPSLAKITTKNERVSPDLLKKAESEVRSEMVITRNRLVHATDDIERRKHANSVDRLKEAQDHIQKLKSSVKDVTATQGGTSNPHEFLVA